MIRKIEKRQQTRELDAHIEEQLVVVVYWPVFHHGLVSVGRSDGYVTFLLVNFL